MDHAHDRSYKQLFSEPLTVQDLLTGFVKEDWVEKLDFSTLEKVSGSFVSDDLRGRESDVIWRIQFEGSCTCYWSSKAVLIHSWPYA